MKSNTSVKPYGRIPCIYNYIMEGIRYDRWAEYLFKLTSSRICKTPKVLELAAGSCSLSSILVKRYPGLISTDLSINMLKQSDCSKLKKVCCDMLRLPFRTKFDLIFSAFDSVNYITSLKKLEIFFTAVKELLADEGIFTFDVSLIKNSIEHLKYLNRTGEYRGIKFRQKSILLKKSLLHKNIFFLKFPSGETFVEVHRQKIYPFEIYFELLLKSGLYVADCYETFSFKEGTKNSLRVQFIVKKSKSNGVI